LTDFDEIWYGDAYLPSEPNLLSKFEILKIQAATILKVKKLQYVQN